MKSNGEEGKKKNRGEIINGSGFNKYDNWVIFFFLSRSLSLACAPTLSIVAIVVLATIEN